ncbi:MAG: methyltransferase domain-containing protein [Bacteroidales bacterium]
MKIDQFSQAITKRYDQLSGQECCLSCGGAFSLATIEEGFVCVDLGAGKGLDVLRMASLAGDKGFAYGVDISDKMMEVALQNAERLKISNVKFIKSPLEQIDLEPGIADVIISNCTLNHSLDQAKVWKEISRILKPGGTFVVSDIYALEDIPGEYRNDPQAVSECWAGAVTREKYIDNILQAGLSGIEMLEESTPYEKGKTRVASFTVKGNKSH